MNKSLIIGLGFGEAVYKPILEKISKQVITFDIDSSKNPNYTDIKQLLNDHNKFDTVNICTPNFTHGYFARKLANYAKIIFVEKPGVINEFEWNKLVYDFPNTRFMVTKNNQYRNEITTFRELAEKSSEIKIKWINNDRIPGAGGWFTDKSMSYGGVSKDLMPHLLSYYCLFEDLNVKPYFKFKSQQWSLDDCNISNYGNVNKTGTFNVDTFCTMEFYSKNKTWILTSDWKSNKGYDEVNIEFDGKNFELGLCPEYAYEKMIKTAFELQDDREFWKYQLKQDSFIHNILNF